MCRADAIVVVGHFAIQALVESDVLRAIELPDCAGLKVEEGVLGNSLDRLVNTNR